MHQSFEYDVCSQLSEEINARINKLMFSSTDDDWLNGISIWQEFQEWYCVKTDAIIVPQKYDR